MKHLRSFLAGLAAWAVLDSLHAADLRDPALESSPWYAHSLVGLEVGPTGSQFGSSPSDVGFASRFNGGDIARATQACGAEYLVIWAREGDWVFYDSKFQPKPPGLGNRDVLREAVGEGHRLGLPVIAYCQVQYPGHTLREHPDWRAVASDGKPIDGRVCYRSGYLEYLKQMVDEQLAYGIDGFHLDMVDQGFGPPYGCWCATCRKEFEAEYGRPMPAGVTWDEDWDRMLKFRYAGSERFEKELTAHIRRVNPRATVDYNYHGNPPFSWEVGQRPVQHAGNGDFVTGETGVWGFSALTVGLNAEFYRAATPGLPFQIAMQRGVRMYHDQTTRPLNDLRWELLTLLSHGGFVTIVDKTAFDGWLDPVAYERFGAAFREVAAKRSQFGHPAVYEVGLYFSSRTRDWFGRDQPAKYFQSFQGAHKAMVYEHIPWGVILDEKVTLETLKRFPVVMLPNVAIVSDKEVALFRRYVEEGGKLLVTGLTGTRGWRGERREESALQELAGAKLVRELDSTDNWVRFSTRSDVIVEPWAPSESMRGSARTNWPFLVRGPAVVYEATTATPIGELLKPHRTSLHVEGRYNQDWPLSADTPVGPAMLLNHVGNGAVLTFAGSPDWATASDHHITETRKLLANAVRLLNPEPWVRIEAPTTVQTVVTDDPIARTLRVHLLGYDAPPQTTPAKDRPYVLPVPIEDAPIFRVTIEVRDGFKRAKAFNPATELKKGGNRLELLVEDIHEVVQLSY
ncbi:MAG: beta-galactosidase trimerization domain-containing protein [Verrucomicrobiales bacterium]|nr:beta-galactosidase trimerization domain-containing protein [Verrucomicrobiales bacterium]